MQSNFRNVKFLVILLSLGIFGRSAAALELSVKPFKKIIACARLLAPKGTAVSSDMKYFRRRGYTTVNYSYPVRKQHFDTCWLHAGVSQMESYLGRPLNMDFYYLRLIWMKFWHLEEILKHPLDLLDPYEKNGFFNSSLGGYSGGAGAQFIQFSGIVPVEKFAWPESFVWRLKDNPPKGVKVAGVDNLATLTTAELLNLQMGKIIVDAKWALVRGEDFVSVYDKAFEEIANYLLRTESSSPPELEREALNPHPYKNILTFDIHQSPPSAEPLPEDKLNAAERFIIQSIDAQIPPVIAYQYPLIWDWVNAAIVVPPDSTFANPFNIKISGHAAAIVGYRLGKDGHIESFLIKQSHGPKYRRGYQEFSAAALWPLAMQMFSFKPNPATAATPQSP